MELHWSVILVSYHTGPALWFSLASVLGQAELLEVVIVDNGNPLWVRERLQRLAARDARVTLLSGHGNVGFASACNLGAAQAKGAFLLLLNPDCVLPEGALTRTREALESHPNAWLAGCHLVGTDGSEQIGGRRHVLTPWKALVEGLKLYRLAPRHPYFARLNLHETLPLQDAGSVPAISGAYMAMPRARYAALHGMDERYFLHVEDLDFCYRVRASGGDILYLPAVRVIHCRSTSNAASWRVEWHKARGFMRYFHTHFASTYPRGFLWLLDGAALARAAVRVLGGLFPTHAPSPSAREVRRSLLLATAPYLPEPVAETPRRVLLTGATGQVGLCILRRLLKAGHQVTALQHRAKIALAAPHLDWRQGGLDAPLPLSGLRLDTYIQTAAIWLLPQQIPSLAAAGVRRLICFSSTSVQGKAGSTHPEERELVRKFQQAEAEVARLCEAHGIRWTIFRPTLIYGVGLDKNICAIARFMRRLRMFPLSSPATGLRQPVHADDLAAAVLLALEHPQACSRIFELSGGESLPYDAMVKRVAESLPFRVRIVKTRLLPLVMDALSRLTGRVELNGEIARRMNQDLVFPHDAAREAFGYHPRRFLDPNWPELTGMASGE
jgi:N-acetylglucosaminyl-diphospho-decaprenol L-rhamnosyltransferase